MNRSQEDIVARVRGEKDRDFLGWALSDLLEWLDFEHAREFLKPDATAESWAEVVKERKSPRERMIDYMPFAWEKANNCRGLSAGRSLNHYTNWLWLDGQDELADSMDNYEYYGKDNLVAICEYLGLDPKTWDNGVRVNSEEELA